MTGAGCFYSCLILYILSFVEKYSISITISAFHVGYKIAFSGYAFYKTARNVEKHLINRYLSALHIMRFSGTQFERARQTPISCRFPADSACTPPALASKHAARWNVETEMAGPRINWSAPISTAALIARTRGRQREIARRRSIRDTRRARVVEYVQSSRIDPLQPGSITQVAKATGIDHRRVCEDFRALGWRSATARARTDGVAGSHDVRGVRDSARVARAMQAAGVTPEKEREGK